MASTRGADHTAPMEAANDGKEILNLPTGYHFCPQHHVMINYLKKKILGRKLPADIIPTIDLYRYNPNQIPLDEFKYGQEGEWYFFTTRPEGDEFVVKDGYWKSSSKKEIKHGGEVIGFKQVIDFFWGASPNGIKSNYRIHEYRLNPDTLEATELNDNIKDKIKNFVACKVTVIDKCLEKMIQDLDTSSLMSSIESFRILRQSEDENTEMDVNNVVRDGNSTNDNSNDNGDNE